RLDFLRRGQPGDCGHDLRIGNTNKRTCARRFQNHLMATASPIRKTRQHENGGVVERGYSWPISWHLRCDDALVARFERGPKLVFQQAVCGQLSNQTMNVVVDDLSAALERTERQTGVDILRALHGIRAKCSQPERMTIDADGQFPA